MSAGHRASLPAAPTTDWYVYGGSSVQVLAPPSPEDELHAAKKTIVGASRTKECNLSLPRVSRNNVCSPPAVEPSARVLRYLRGHRNRGMTGTMLVRTGCNGNPNGWPAGDSSSQAARANWMGSVRHRRIVGPQGAVHEAVGAPAGGRGAPRVALRRTGRGETPLGPPSLLVASQVVIRASAVRERAKRLRRQRHAVPTP